MRWVKVLAVVVAVVVVGLVLMGSLLVDLVTPAGLDAVSNAYGLRVRAADLEIGLVPPRLWAKSVAIGDPQFVTVDEVELDVDVGASLGQRRIVARLTVTGAEVDTALLGDHNTGNGAGDSAGDRRLVAAWVPPFDLATTIEDLLVSAPGARSARVGHASIQVSAGSDIAVALRAEATDVDIRRGGSTLPLDRLRLRSRYRQGTVWLEELEIAGPSLSVRAGRSDGVDAERGEPLDGTSRRARLAAVPIQFAGDLGPISRLVAADVDVTGRLELGGHVGGDLGDPEISLDAVLEAPTWNDARGESLVATVDRRRGTWRILDLRGVTAGGTIDADLTYVEESRRAALKIAWNRLDLNRLDTGSPQPRPLLSSGELEVSANFGGRTGEAEGTARIYSGDILLAPFELRAQLDQSGLSGVLRAVGSPAGALGEDDELTLRVDNSSTDRLEGELVARLTQISTLHPALTALGLPAVGGAAALSARLTGSLRAPVAHVEASAAGLSIAGVAWGRLDAAATVTGTGATLSRLSLTGESGTVSGSGIVALTNAVRNDWGLHLRDVDAAAVGRALNLTTPQPRGRIDAEISAKGTWAALAARAEVSSAELSAGAVEVFDAQGTIEWASGDWDAALRASGGADGANGTARISATGHDGSVRTLAGTVRKWAIRGAVAKPFGAVIGRVNASADLEAAPGGSTGEIEVEVSGLEVGAVALGDSRIRGDSKQGTWTLAGTLFDHRADVSARIEESGGRGFDVAADWADVEVAGVRVRGNDLSAQLSGTLRLKGRIGSLPDTDGRIELSRLAIDGSYDTVRNQGPIVVRFRRGAVTLEPSVLVGNQTRLEGHAAVRPGQGFAASVAGSVNLGWLELASDAIGAAKGVVEIDLSAAGDSQSPLRVEGRLALDRAALEVGSWAYVSDISGEVKVESGVFRTAGITARVGAGKVAVRGEIAPGSGIDLHWQVRNVALAPAEHLEGLISGQGSLTGAWEEVALTGTVEVDELLYDRDLRFKDILPSFARVVDPAPEVTALRPPLRLDLRLRARDGIYIDNNIARLEARADLRLSGTAREPAVRGEVEVIDGKIELRGRHFEIVNGVLTFKPKLGSGAHIDFLAESFIETPDLAYLVEVRVSGTTDRYRVHLGSEDGLSQTDVASLIAFGKTVAQLQETSARSEESTDSGGGLGVSLDQVVGLAGGQVGKMLGEAAHEVLPFDEVQLQPGFSPSTGEFETQIRIRKDITENLAAWVVQSFGVQSQTAVEARYDLSSRISTAVRWRSRTSTSEQGGIGADIAQIADFWRLPGWLSWGSGWGPSEFGGTLD